jgi:hypothetical protein
MEKTDESSKIIPKLHNSLELAHRQLPLMKYSEAVTIKLSMVGGCDLSYKPQMATIDSFKILTE